ncbi:uncharacterized protein [Argopecten irradians]|uniref:uncharacterized protein n=1 Tax=Argopecten irradians TaxID=31199 RepID=UPI00371AC19C
MMNCLHNWCWKWRLTVNVEKTNVIHFRNKSVPKSNFQFTCGDLNIQTTDRYKYLGIWFTEHLDMELTVKELAKSASRALGALYSKFRFAGGMSFGVFKNLYESLVEPVLFYCAGIWGINSYRFVQTVQNKAGRYFLGSGKNASNVATRGDLGWNSCATKQKIEVCRLWLKLKCCEPRRLIKTIHIWSLSRGRSWDKRVESMLNIRNLNSLLEPTPCYISGLNNAKLVFKQEDVTNWYRQMWNDSGQDNRNKLRTYRTYKNNLAPELYVTLIMNYKHRQTLAKFRCGNLKLKVETGRYSHPVIPLQGEKMYFVQFRLYRR